MTRCIYLLFNIILSVITSTSAAGCVINPFAARAPLLISPENTTVIYPSHGQKTISLSAGETVEFACPGRQVILDGSTSVSVVEASCISNTTFRINGNDVLWGRVSCSNVIYAQGRFTNSNCGINARLAEIGYNLNNNRFLRIITICYDVQEQIALYSFFDLPKSVNSFDLNNPRPQFYEDKAFYHTGSRTINQLYVRKGQRTTINRLLGLPASSTKYITAGQELFLSRGHLTARADFMYGIFQNSTFRYINAAPQWQIFNENNWNQVEIDTRNYADRNQVNLQIWTGTYGVAALPHATTGEDIPLYLYADGNTRGIPVPSMYWKLLYEPITKRGIVLIGLNNPYQDDVSKHIICSDVSSQVHWLNWDHKNIRSGYSYACTVANFRKAVPYAPNLNVAGLLV